MNKTLQRHMDYIQRGIRSMNEEYVDFLEVFQGKDHQWYYRGKSNNGEVLFTSEGYAQRGGAVEAANLVARDNDNIDVRYGGPVSETAEPEAPVEEEEAPVEEEQPEEETAEDS
jgi:uncharacterized protein YegP (UPF0339 family)